MAHIVNRRGYLSLEESYRDANGKPRKRYLKYLGKLGQIDWAGTFRSDPGMAAAERAMEKAEKNKEPVVEEVSKLPDGLHTGPTDPIAPADVLDVQSQSNQADEPSTDDAGSDDDSGS